MHCFINVSLSCEIGYRLVEYVVIVLLLFSLLFPWLEVFFNQYLAFLLSEDVSFCIKVLP